MSDDLRRIPELAGLIRLGSGTLERVAHSGIGARFCNVNGIQVMLAGRLRFRNDAMTELATRLGSEHAIAQSWRQNAQGVLESVAGEFLLGLWDSHTRRGLLAVDRFSSFPLFWGERDGRLAFGSTPVAVANRLEISSEVEPRAVHAYLYFHMIPAPLSILRGVQRLEGGQAILIEGGKTRILEHWIPRFVEGPAFDFADARQEFRAALRDGIDECIAGVPRERLGCFLSGGTDSSTIAGLVTEAYGAPAKTFSIGFDVSGYDERQFSRIAARHFGTDHVEHVMTPLEAETGISTVAAEYEQPFGNSSALPTFICARLARDAGVDRMLGGDGGDELYGGNERYARQWLFSLYDRLPSGVRRGLIEPALFGPLEQTAFWPIRKARGYVEQARVPLPDRLGSKYNLLNRFGPQRVLADAVLGNGDAFDPAALEREVWARCSSPSQVNRLLAYDFKFTLADNDLQKVVRMCNAAGTEVAFPLLCEAPVDFSFKLPPDQKLRRSRLRPFFKEALRGFLPDEIITKPKHGFGMPFGDWLLGQPRLSSRAQDALASLAARGLIRVEFIDELAEALRSGHAGYFGTMIWVLMMLELWFESHPTVDARMSGVSG